MRANSDAGRNGQTPGRRTLNVAWLVLLLGGLCEIAWASMLNQAQGLTHPGWLVAGLAVSVASVLMLGWAMRVIDLGTGYAAWIGVGSAGSVLAGVLAFGESTNPLRLFFIACIILGIVGLRFTEAGAPPGDVAPNEH